MQARFLTLAVVFALFCPAFAAPARAQDAHNNQGTKPANRPAVRARQLEALIDALANKNKPPKLPEIVAFRESHRPPFDAKYDWTEQERVWKACLTLLQRERTDGNDLWQHIAEHADDKRYAFTCWTESHDPYVGPYNIRVGEICRHIAYRDLVCAFAQIWEGGPIFDVRLDDGHFYKDLPWRDVKTWCRARPGKPLWELQIEVGQWGIKKLEGVDGAQNKEKADSLQKTPALIDALRKTKKPIVNKYPTVIIERIKFYKPPKGQEVPGTAYVDETPEH